MKTAILLISAIGLVGCGGYYGPTDYYGVAGSGGSIGSAGAGGNDGGLNSPCDIHLDCVAPMSCQEKTTVNGVVKTCQCAYCQVDTDCPTSSYYCIRGGCYHACNADSDCNSADTCQTDTIVNGPKLGQVTVCE